MKRTGRWYGIFLLLLLGTGLTGGCAHSPQEKIETAAFAVNQAEQRNATQYATLELRYARDNLNRAREAVELKNYDEAERLAEKALADARLASARAESAKAQEELTLLRSDIEELRQEISRMQEQEQ
ncbi:MAG: DUF4398 domain-containing protein [Desulfovibrionales bacterium]